MHTPLTTGEWMRERDRAWRRRQYLQRLSRSVRDLREARWNGPRADEAWRRLMQDLAHLGDIVPES